jgi:hypothetical protein
MLLMMPQLPIAAANSRHVKKASEHYKTSLMRIRSLATGCQEKNCMRLILALALAFIFAHPAWAQDLVFETSMARLVIKSNGTVGGLIEKQNGKERLQPGGLPFAAVRKNGASFHSTSMSERPDALYHVTFGDSGVSADYRITASAEYIVVELAAIRGEGIENLQMVRLGTLLRNVGGTLLNVLWDDDFAVSLMGLSQQVDTRITGQVTSATLYPQFSMVGQRVGIIAVPTSRFMEVAQKVEHDFELPSSTIGGTWAKQSADARTSYLFTDLREANADEMISYAKMGGLHYILIHSSSWAASLGSYPINLTNYPNGESGLKSVIDKCHAAGLKVGMRMLTSLVGKDDPFVRPKPDPGLLKNGEVILGTEVSAHATELTIASRLTLSPLPAGSSDFVIGDEIIHCGQIMGAKFLHCQRGFNETNPMPHPAGAKAEQLAERYGSYLADLRSPLAGAISDRISGLINRVGFDMIYFDGGELNDAQGVASWYWASVQQAQIWQRSRRDLLMQGSGATNWTWHLFARGTCDDTAAVAVKQYLDYHKIADDWTLYHNSFVPVDLGWVAILNHTADHPATTPDELEYHAVRMLALDSPVGFQADQAQLKANGRTEEMLKLLGVYEQLRLSGAVPNSVRKQLAQGEWHMTAPGEFHPIRYEAQRLSIPAKVTVQNGFDEQPLKFRLQATPSLATIGDSANIRLLQSEAPIEIQPPAVQNEMPGALVKRIGFIAPLNLITHRALAVELEVDGADQGPGESDVLNIQLDSKGLFYRDYYVDLNFRGSKTLILSEAGTERMLPEFRPAASSYPFKSATQSFDYGHVDALNVRWMRYASGGRLRCHLKLVEALQEGTNTLKDIEISAGAAKIVIPGAMQTGDYAEDWGEGLIHVFNRNGVLLRTVTANSVPLLRGGDNMLTLKAAGPANVKLTVITLGK